MCRCVNDTVCGTHRDEINARLDRVDSIRAARRVDTVEVDRILAELRYDYGDRVDTVIAERRAAGVIR